MIETLTREYPLCFHDLRSNTGVVIASQLGGALD